MANQQRVLLTGAAGTLGSSTFNELLQRDDCQLVLLLRPSEKNREYFKPYIDRDDIEVIWGDACDKVDLEKACTNVDWVFAVHALIPPGAFDVSASERINYQSIADLLDVIKQQPNGLERIKLVFISSISQTGDRRGKVGLTRMGDPINPSVTDYYGLHKAKAERAVIASGLKYWVCLRSTYIIPPLEKMSSDMEAIVFHQPLDTRVEMISHLDAGYALAKTLDMSDENSFWRRVYHLAGGPECRFMAADYLLKFFSMQGVKHLSEIADRHWFALRNFNGSWFEDSDLLNDYLGHWRHTLNDHYAELDVAASYMTDDMKVAPDIIREGIKELLQTSKQGTLYWRENNCEMWLNAFYGPKTAYENIPDWGEPLYDLNIETIRLNHGYDESKSQLELDDLQEVAYFRGGKLISSEWSGDVHCSLKWESASGESFSATAYQILKAGYWAPGDLEAPWRGNAIAKENPFFAQVWLANHTPDEDIEYNI